MIKLNTISTNQTIVTHSQGTTLFSYDTPICTKCLNGSIILHPDWKYSSTTSKHRNRFLNETTTLTTQKLIDGVYALKMFSSDISE